MKYLTHELSLCVKYDSNFDYICKICGIILYRTSVGGKFFAIYMDEYGEDQAENTECKLTCDDFIIKNIIE